MPDAAVVVPEESLEAYRVLVDEAKGRTGHIPPELLARHALRVTRDADFPVQRAALEALLRRLAPVRTKEGLPLASRPRAASGLGLYRIHRQRPGQPWRVLLRSFDPPGGSCDCPDFAKASLGLCKHLLWLLHRGFATQRPLPAGPPLARPELGWNPVRPLTGPGDWLERVEWRPTPRTQSSTPALALAALGRHFQPPATDGARPLKPECVSSPERRLAAVRDLSAAARAGLGGAADPALAPLLDRELERLSQLRDARWTERELKAALGTLRRPLFPYQVEGVRRFLLSERLLLADDMGLGKTAQAIAGCHALFHAGRVRRGLLVVPAALKPQWLREWRSFSDAPIELVDGPPEERARAYRRTRKGFLLVNYEQVIRDLPHLLRLEPEVAVLDEAQRIKNWATKTAACVKRLTPRHRLVLTGTPLENRLDELASLLEWVDELALEPRWRLGPWHSTFADGSREVIGARNLDTLRRRLEPSTLRRVRKEVLTQLPPRRDTRLPVPLTPEQEGAHEELNRPIANLLGRARKRPLTQAEFLQLMTLLTRQRIICNGLALQDFVETWPSLQAARPTEPVLKGLFTPKLQELRELVAQLVLTQERKVVIFSQWRRMLRLAEWALSSVLGEGGVRAVYFSGEEGQRRRTQNLVDFHDDPHTRVLLATDAGGVGLNLQRAASACVHLDLPWNPAVLEQRTGRIFRMGQTQPVEVYYLVAASGIEARIAGLVGDKKALFDGLFDGGSDEVRFERSGSFLSQVERLLAPAVVPAESVEEEDEASPEAEELSDEAPGGAVVEVTPRVEPASVTPGAPAPSAAAAEAATESPRPEAAAVAGLFSRVEVRRSSDGGLTLTAPPDAAQALAAVLQGLAGLLSAGPRP